MKIVAAFISNSLSVLSSVIDSSIDIAASVLLFCATRAIKRRDPFMYPQGKISKTISATFITCQRISLGRTRLEPIAIVFLAAFMCAASVQIIRESSETTIKDIKALKNYPSNSSEGVHEINMTVVPIVIMCTTIGNQFFR
jgi:divalent metal cation (Fe/Co/Zn/Cd) transporter